MGGSDEGKRGVSCASNTSVAGLGSGSECTETSRKSTDLFGLLGRLLHLWRW